MPITLPKEPVVAALDEVWDRLDDLLAGLDDAAWGTPTCLPGWDVKAVVAHIIGTESEVRDTVQAWEDTGVTTLMLSAHSGDEVRRIAEVLA